MLAPLLKHKSNLQELPKLVHLFWGQNIQTSFYQYLCYFRQTGLKTIFIALVTCPKLLLIGDEKCNGALLWDRAACSCFMVVLLSRKRLCGWYERHIQWRSQFSNRSVNSAKVIEGNWFQKAIIGLCVKENIFSSDGKSHNQILFKLLIINLFKGFL